MIYLFCLITFIFSLYFFYKIAPLFKLVDSPNYRKIHKGEVPLVGGIIIFLNILFYSFFYEASYYLNFILYTSSILLFLGVIDDSIELGINFRLITQLASSLIIVGSGLMIKNIGAYSFLPNIEIGFISVIFTVFCVIGLTNAFNFMDGIDGLCAGLSLIAIISVIFFSYLTGTLTNFSDKNFLILICFIILIFMIINITNYYKVFLGDAGSIFLGFFVSWLLIMTSQDKNYIIPPILTIWCVSLPVFDIISVIIRRVIKKNNPFKPDRTHIHHILLNLGFSSSKTLIIILLCALIFNILGFIIFYLLGPLPCLLVFLIILIFYIFLMIYITNTKTI